jgi:hypothetical protein
MVQRGSDRPHYVLKQIKQEVKNGNIDFSPNAAQRAFDDFIWTTDDIKKCFLKLNLGDFHRRGFNDRFPNEELDIYIKKNYDGFNVYMHFYKNSCGEIIINSCHKANI